MSGSTGIGRATWRERRSVAFAGWRSSSRRGARVGRRRLGVVDDRERQRLRAAGFLGKGRSLADQESIGGDAERGVVMESSPASPFELGEAEFALEFLIVAFDAPGQFAVSRVLRSACPRAGSRASIWSARARPSAIRSATIRADAGPRVSRLARPAESAPRRSARSGSGWSPRARTGLAKPAVAASSPAPWPRPADDRPRALSIASLRR